jgi:DNA-binding CsgD family transcriptional regulator
LAGDSRAMDPELIADLTDAEKEVLRLYLKTSDPKEIARAIDRSQHTVDQRLARARRKLGVTRSLDAAHLLAHAEGNPAYGAAIYGSSLRGDALPFVLKRPPSEGGAGPASLAPFPTKGRPWNALPPWTRALMIVGGMFAIAVTAVVIVSIGEALSSIARQHH